MRTNPIPPDVAEALRAAQAAIINITHNYACQQVLEEDGLAPLTAAYDLLAVLTSADRAYHAVKQGMQIDRIGTHTVDRNHVCAWVRDPASPSGRRSLPGFCYHARMVALARNFGIEPGSSYRLPCPTPA